MNLAISTVEFNDVEKNICAEMEHKNVFVVCLESLTNSLQSKRYFREAFENFAKKTKSSISPISLSPLDDIEDACFFVDTSMDTSTLDHLKLVENVGLVFQHEYNFLTKNKTTNAQLLKCLKMSTITSRECMSIVYAFLYDKISIRYALLKEKCDFLHDIKNKNFTMKEKAKMVDYIFGILEKKKDDELMSQLVSVIFDIGATFCVRLNQFRLYNNVDIDHVNKREKKRLKRQRIREKFGTKSERKKHAQKMKKMKKEAYKFAMDECKKRNNGQVDIVVLKERWKLEENEIDFEDFKQSYIGVFTFDDGVVKIRTPKHKKIKKKKKVKNEKALLKREYNDFNDIRRAKKKRKIYNKRKKEKFREKKRKLKNPSYPPKKKRKLE